MTAGSKYKRILVKLSGEALLGESDYGVDPLVLRRIAAEIQELLAMGVQVAVVIGGGSLRGGEGSVVGTLIGGFIMGLLANGCDLLGINPYWQQVIIGAVIILAVSVDELRKRRAV